MLKLFTYFRSSAAYRVRLALQLKGLPYEAALVHLVRNGGEHLQASYRAVNPGAMLPCLQDGGTTISKSLAILEYLEEAYPGKPLLPADAAGRARVRALALMVACDIHPLNNLRVLKYLSGDLEVSEANKTAWYRHWIEEGFRIIETHLAREAQTGSFAHGDRPTLADCCLVPQVFNAQRFKVDLSAMPITMRVFEACMKLPAFEAAQLARQPEAARAL